MKITMRSLVTVMAVVVVMAVAFAFTACQVGEESADRIQTKQSETLFKEAQREIGLPNIKNFQQRKTLRDIFELADQENLICYAYLFNPYQGKLLYIGRCLGYGIPFSAQFTNPEKVVQGDKELGYDLSGYVNYPMLKPQADPNGLYMPTSSSATWVILLDEDNNPRPIYVEPTLVVSPIPMPDWLVIKGPDKPSVVEELAK